MEFHVPRPANLAQTKARFQQPLTRKALPSAFFCQPFLRRRGLLHKSRRSVIDPPMLAPRSATANVTIEEPRPAREGAEKGLATETALTAESGRERQTLPTPAPRAVPRALGPTSGRATTSWLYDYGGGLHCPVAPGRGRVGRPGLRRSSALHTSPGTGHRLRTRRTSRHRAAPRPPRRAHTTARSQARTWRTS